MDQRVPRRVAVLGGTGCVGRHICAAFAARCEDVVALARTPAQPIGAYRFHAVDLATATSGELAALLRGYEVDTVVNATGGWGLTEDEMGTVRLRLVDRMLDAVSQVPGRPRLVQVGTIHEYGPAPDGTPITEQTVPDPQTRYARTKLAESQRILALARTGDLDAVVLRLVNTFGPYPAQESFFTSVAVRLMDAAQVPLDLTVAAARRDYLDARDAASAVVAAARLRTADPLVNIGYGRALDIRSLLAVLVRAGGLPADAVRLHDGEVSGMGGAASTEVDISRARRLLGWRPRFDAADSMRDMWATLRAERAVSR